MKFIQIIGLGGDEDGFHGIDYLGLIGCVGGLSEGDVGKVHGAGRNDGTGQKKSSEKGHEESPCH
jgi:hypothetical protein